MGLWGAQADAACRAIPPADQSRLAPLIFTGTFESGPITPAVIRVEQWEKGTGPALVEVDTGIYEDYALGEGISPRPGERWRIFGEPVDGQVLTGACDGSRRVAGAPLAPSAKVGARSVPLARATWLGTPLGPAMPQITVPAGSRVTLTGKVLAVRVLGRQARAARRRGGRWSVRVPAAGRTIRIVADTGSGFFAARLRAAG